MWTKMYFIIKSGNIGRILFLPSLLSGPSRLSQVIGLSVGMCSVCLLHSGRQLRARLHCSGGTKQAQARRRRRRGGRGGAEEQCAKREKEKLCITFSCCSFSSGWPRSGGTEECVPDKLFIPRPGCGTPRSDADRRRPRVPGTRKWPPSPSVAR